MKLQLTLLVLGLTYVLSAPTDPSDSTELNDSDPSSEHPLEENDTEYNDEYFNELLTKLNTYLGRLGQALDTIIADELAEKEFWIKIKEGLEEIKTNGLEINTFIQEKYNDFQDLDKHITGADDASKDYFNNVLVTQFHEIKEKTLPCQEGLKKAKQLVSEKMNPENYYSNYGEIDSELYCALDILVNPYNIYMDAFKSHLEDAFALEDEEEKKQEIKEIVKEIKEYFNPSWDDDSEDESGNESEDETQVKIKDDSGEEHDFKPYSSFIISIDGILNKINWFIEEENEQNDEDERNDD